MKVRTVNIKLVVGSLSDIEADAYVLPYFPYHVNPDNERLEVKSAGARGVRRFIDLRMTRHLRGHNLSLGEMYITQSGGGKSKFLVNIVCRSHNAENICSGIHTGLIGMFVEAPKYHLQTVAMPPLCIRDGLTELAFVHELWSAIESYVQDVSIAEIIIACKDEEQRVKI